MAGFFLSHFSKAISEWGKENWTFYEYNAVR